MNEFSGFTPLLSAFWNAGRARPLWNDLIYLSLYRLRIATPPPACPELNRPPLNHQGDAR
ncbi:MAG TPA: hypothetical protein VGL72_25935 [Bryobacteraceae bacterium]|jgi:hypothetical protein